jgi:hypothetical protein
MRLLTWIIVIILIGLFVWSILRINYKRSEVNKFVFYELPNKSGRAVTVYTTGSYATNKMCKTDCVNGDCPIGFCPRSMDIPDGFKVYNSYNNMKSEINKRCYNNIYCNGCEKNLDMMKNPTINIVKM